MRSYVVLLFVLVFVFDSDVARGPNAAAEGCWLLLFLRTVLLLAKHGL
jgi:hypothetical protein